MDQRLHARCALILILIWLVLPLVIILSIPAGHGVRIRYLLFLLPVYLILVAFGLNVTILWLTDQLDRVRHPAMSRRIAGGLVAAVLLGALAGISTPRIISHYGEGKQNWRDATQLVQSSAEPGERVFVSRLHHQTGVLFYASQQDVGLTPLAAEDVQILPKNPTQDLLPAETDRGWLIVPVREEYLPGGGASWTRSSSLTTSSRNPPSCPYRACPRTAN
jgi:hypothetical protein